MSALDWMHRAGADTLLQPVPALLHNQHHGVVAHCSTAAACMYRDQDAKSGTVVDYDVGIASRDIKCDNVLLMGLDATVKLADFGWSCADQVNPEVIEVAQQTNFFV